MLTNFVILLLSVISPIYGGKSQEYCESSVSERIRLLRNYFEVFQKNIAFDPQDSKKPVTKYELYPNGWMSYRINSEEVGTSGSDNALWNMKYIDDNGDQQTLRINAEEKEYQVTHETEVVALLSTLQVLDKKEVQKAQYIPVLEKMISIYKSAILFHTNLQTKNIPGIEGKVTLYEVTADGATEFETDFTLKISENHSKIENFSINGKYECSFVDIDRQMHGEYGSDYTYHVNSGDITLTHQYLSAVM